MSKFTRLQLEDLQDIIDGKHFDSIAISKAVIGTDDQEVKILLTNLLNGLFTHEMRMNLQQFICDEYHKLTQ